MKLAKEWWTLSELVAAKLPGMPTTMQGWDMLVKREGWRTRLDMTGSPLARRRKGRGGGWKYHWHQLPDQTKKRLVAKDAQEKKAAREADGLETPSGKGEQWRWFNGLPEKRRDKAQARRDLLEEIELLHRGGVSKSEAVFTVAKREGIGASSIYSWFKTVAGRPREDWLAFLAPRHAGRQTTAECDPRAWEVLKTDYLRAEKPSFTSCFDRLAEIAGANGWTIPAPRTLIRRIENEIPVPIRVLQREGPDELRRLYPWEERDRTQFHALEAVNADYHTADVMVEWPDGSKDRPSIIAIQDLYSNKMVAWRVDLNPTAAGVRLALYDMFKTYGIPDLAFLDNGREFAAKMITGGQKTRYRFKVNAGDMHGVLTALDVEMHWTKPYSGQSKPIERAFRDFCDRIAKHPAFAGAYTGNSPVTKPANYGQRAVPLETFIKILGQGVLAYNAKPGRNTRVCGRRMSFDEAFGASYRDSLIRRASEEQLQLSMLAAEAVTARRPNGSVHVMGSRYWGEFLTGHIGKKVVARYDPDDLAAGVHVYRLTGEYTGFAECWEAGPFLSAGEKNDHERNRRKYAKAVKEQAALEVSMSIEDVAAMLPDVEEEEPPETRTIRPLFAGNAAIKAEPEIDDQEKEESELLMFRRLGKALDMKEGQQE